jgi:predicted nucleic acid-binding protein
VIAIVDAGPLYAAADESDDYHAACVSALQRPELHLVLPALAVAEALYLVGRRLGPHAEAAFARGLAEFDVENPSADWTRIGDLVEQYADFPLGSADASVVAAAERLGTDLILTLDHRHFSAVRPRHCDMFRLQPE